MPTWRIVRRPANSFVHHDDLGVIVAVTSHSPSVPA
jgi:hypothetical protein